MANTLKGTTLPHTLTPFVALSLLVFVRSKERLSPMTLNCQMSFVLDPVGGVFVVFDFSSLALIAYQPFVVLSINFKGAFLNYPNF